MNGSFASGVSDSRIARLFANDRNHAPPDFGAVEASELQEAITTELLQMSLAVLGIVRLTATKINKHKNHLVLLQCPLDVPDFDHL